MTHLDADNLRKLDTLNLIEAIANSDLTKANAILNLYPTPEDRYWLILTLAGCAASMARRIRPQQLARVRRHLLDNESHNG